MENLKEKALSYHQHPQPGKIAVVPTKPYADPADLSLAYSPGVAYPCKEIKENPAAVRHYTGRSNLVAVISNGTAVLGPFAAFFLRIFQECYSSFQVQSRNVNVPGAVTSKRMVSVWLEPS
mgnify:CR=1 FL=1